MCKGERAAAWQGGKWASNGKRWAIYLRDGMACVYCGEYFRLSLDHVIPANQGGSNEPSNLVTACESCNYARQDKSMRQWMRWLRDNRGMTIEQTSALCARIRRLTHKSTNYHQGRGYYMLRRVIRSNNTAANINAKVGTVDAI